MSKKYRVKLGPDVEGEIDELLEKGTPEEIAEVQAAMDGLMRAAEKRHHRGDLRAGRRGRAGERGS